MEAIQIRYRFKNISTEEVTTIRCYVEDLERSNKSLFEILDSFDYQLLSRDLYTGIADHIGSMIYFNDILLVRDIFHLVIWHKDQVMLAPRGNKQYDKCLWGHHIGWSQLVGNAHDNPEMLKRDFNGN